MDNMAKIQITWAAYRKTDWVNDMPPSIDDYNLDKMEEGIYQNSLHIKELIDICMRQDDELDAIRADVASLTNRMTTAENDIKTLKSNVDTLDKTKANKDNVPTNADFQKELAKKVNNTTYNTFVNNTLPNTYYKKSETYSKTEIDNLLKNKLNRGGDTTNGNYTFNNNVTVGGQIKTNQDYIKLAGHDLHLRDGHATIYA